MSRTLFVQNHPFENKYVIGAQCLSLRKLVTDQSQTFCCLPPSFFPGILSPLFSFFVAFRCIPSACKTNSEDIVKMDSGKFGKLSVGLIINLHFYIPCKGFIGFVLASPVLQTNDILMQSVYDIKLASGILSIRDFYHVFHFKAIVS